MISYIYHFAFAAAILLWWIRNTDHHWIWKDSPIRRSRTARWKSAESL